MAKKAMAFRLSDPARRRLAELAVESGRSATAIIEDLILNSPGSWKGMKRPVMGEVADDAKPVDEKYDGPPAPKKSRATDVTVQGPPPLRLKPDLEKIAEAQRRLLKPRGKK